MGIFGEPWFMLIIGLLIGWGLEWAIDIVYFRRRARSIEGAERAVEERDRFQKQVGDQAKVIEELRAELAVHRSEHQAEVDGLRQKISVIDGIAKGEVMTERDEPVTTQYKLPETIARAEVGEVRILRDEEAAGQPKKVYVKAAGRRGGVRDSFRDLKGIGPKYERLLWDAGIERFEDLGQITEERVIEIIQPESWQKVDARAWIAEAQSRVRSRV